MNMKRIILAGCSIVVLSVGAAMAGPCDTGGRASLKDAGSGLLAAVRRQQARRLIRSIRQPAQ